MKRLALVCAVSGIILLGFSAPAYASDFSGMIPILIGVFLLGLAFTCAIAWVITLFIPDVKIKWVVRGLAVAGYLGFIFLSLFGF
jgi:hypothetical protein